ncbi:hypothetical protein LDENG_00119420 [Lucifuga dentata]|nr:hypothetical protein LDENG_00119420 [Lucifuga dentata]
MMATGHSLCLPSPATVQELFSVARDASIIPDISMDPVLTSFLSLDSSEALQHQYNFLERSLSEEQRHAFSLSLSTQLGGSRVRHGGVGVVALALSLLFDLLAQQVRAQGLTAGEPLTHRSQAKRIFGISKSSRVGWIVHSYLQQIPAIANNQERMAETTELYDNWLKHELLDHYERMTNKKRMSSESMQQWLTGAAVHLHMRIHQVRLHSVPSGSAESLRLSYKTGLTRLVQVYTAYLRRSIQETGAAGPPPPRDRAAGGLIQTAANTSGTINMTCSGSKSSRNNLDHISSISPSILSTILNETTTPNSTVEVSRMCKTNESSEALGQHVQRISNESTAGTTGRKTISSCSGERRHEEAVRPGLLVIESQRNVTHTVQHRPCESPAIQQALMTRIIDAQDLQRNRDFFLYSEEVFHSLLRQRDDFELKAE